MSKMTNQRYDKDAKSNQDQKRKIKALIKLSDWTYTKNTKSRLLQKCKIEENLKLRN